MPNYYAGVGSTETPSYICRQMTSIASDLEERGYILNSGGANGADLAFENGVKDPRNKQIFIPKQHWNYSFSDLYLDNIKVSDVKEANRIDRYFHPAYERLTEMGELFMTRNTFQVLGIDLNTIVDFVVCWTKDGKDSGGTGQAIRIARSLNVPVFNLKNESDRYAFEEYKTMMEFL